MGGIDRMIENRRAGVSITGDAKADTFLRENPTGVLLGVLYDQQIRAEQAFQGAYRLHERLGHLDPAKIAAMNPDDFSQVFTQSPSVHRFGNMMAERTQKAATYLTDELEGKAASLWKDATTDDDLRSRAQKIPGFGKGKAEVLVLALDLFDYRKQTEEPSAD